MTEIIHFFESVTGKVVAVLAAIFSLTKLYAMITNWRKRLLKEAISELLQPLTKAIEDLKLADKDLLSREEAYKNFQTKELCRTIRSGGENAQSTVQERSSE